jgi:hypothetical protein
LPELRELRSGVYWERVAGRSGVGETRKVVVVH